MRVNASQNVLIGTTTNVARLTAKGSGTTNSTKTFVLQNATPTDLLTVFDNGNTVIGTGSDAGYKLDVSGSGRFTNGLTVTGSLIAPNITGSLQGTSSWATNALTASYLITSSVTSASYAATASYVVTALTASYVQASGVVGLNLSQITTGSVTASVGIGSGSFNITSGSNTLLYISSSGNVGIRTNTPQAQLNINQIAGATKGLFITGDEVYVSGNGDTSKGVRIALGVSRTSNRQLWIGDADAFGSSTLSIFRYQTGASGWAALDSVTGDGITRLVTVIGTDTSNVGIGYNSNAGPTASYYTAKLNVLTYNTSTTNLLINKYGASTGNFLELVDSSSTTLVTIPSSGNLLLGTTADLGYKLDVSGSARITNGLTVTGSLIVTGSISLTGSLSITGSALFYSNLSTSSVTRSMVFAAENIVADAFVPKWLDGPVNTGSVWYVQPNFDFNTVSLIGPGASTTITNVNCLPTIVGTVSNPDITFSNTVTNIKNQARRFSVTSTINQSFNAASLRVGALECFRGSSGAGLTNADTDNGGFFMVWTGGINALQTTQKGYVGLTDNATTIITTGSMDPFLTSSYGKIGFGISGSTGTNWFVMNNTAASAITSASLGTNFPIDTTTLYQFILYAPPSSSYVAYKATNLSSSFSTSGLITANLPAASTTLGRVFWLNNGNTTGTVAIDCVKFNLRVNTF